MDKNEIPEIVATVSPVKGNRPIYSLNNYSNLYCRFYNTITDELWDCNAADMGDAGTVTWDKSAVSLNDLRASRGGYMIAPPEGLPDGWYDVTVYDSEVPSCSDTLRRGKYCYIQGGSIQSMDSI